MVALIDDSKPNSANSAPNTHIVRLNAPAASSSAPRPSTFRIARVWPPLDFGKPRGARDVLRAFGDAQRIERAARAGLFADASDVLGQPHQRAGLLGAERRLDRADGLARPQHGALRDRLLQHGASTTSRAERPAHCVSPSPSRPTLRASLTMVRPARTGADAADGDIGRGGHRKARRRQAQHQPVGLLAHRQMLALAHHVPDIAEHEEIAGDRARQARDVVGIAGHQTRGKAFGKMRRRICVGNGIADALRQFVADGDVLVAGEFDEAVGEIGIARRQRRLDVFGDQRLVVPQSGIDLEIGQRRRVVLRRQNGAGLAGVRPQRRAHRRAERHPCQS